MEKEFTCKMGSASRRPRQEGGRQESEQNRQGAKFILLDNFVAEMPSDDIGQDKCEGGLGEIERANKNCRIDGTQCIRAPESHSKCLRIRLLKL